MLCTGELEESLNMKICQISTEPFQFINSLKFSLQNPAWCPTKVKSQILLFHKCYLDADTQLLNIF